MLPPAFVELKAKTDEFMAKMAEAKGEMDELAKHGSSAGAKLQSFGKYALAGVAGLTLGVGAIAIKEGMAAQKVQASLQAAVQATGKTWAAYKGPLEQAADAQSKFGVNATEAESALATLTIATKSPTKAMAALKLAENVAAGMHINLASAVGIVTKAYAGNSRGLKAMGINLPIASGAAYSLVTANRTLTTAQLHLNEMLQKNPAIVQANNKSHATYVNALRSVQLAQQRVNDMQNASGEIVDALSKRFAGQAQAASQTFAGKLKTLQAQGQNLIETIGLKLIPVVEMLMTKFMGVINFLSKHKTVLIAVATIIGGILTTAITAYIYAQAKAFTKKTLDMVHDFASAFKKLAVKLGLASAAQDTQTEATEGTTTATDELAASEGLALWPILAIIAAIALFIAAVYEIIKHWKTIHEWTVKIWEKIWGFLKHLFDTVWGFIKKWGLRVLLVFATPWLMAFKIVIDFKTKILGFVSDALTWLLNAGKDIVNGLINGVTSAAKALWDFFVLMPLHLIQMGANAVNWLFDMGKNLIKGLINGILHMGSAVLNAITGLLPGPLKGLVSGAGHAIASFFAEGGVVAGPTLSVVGEDGPEAILPLTKPDRMRQILHSIAPYLGDLPSQASGGSSVPMVSSGSTSSINSNANVVINVNGSSDPVATAQAVRTELLKYSRGVSNIGLT